MGRPPEVLRGLCQPPVAAEEVAEQARMWGPKLHLLARPHLLHHVGVERHRLEKCVNILGVCLLRHKGGNHIPLVR